MRLIQAKTLKQWIKIYKLYKKAFPKYERKPFWLILQTKRRGKTDVWYIEEQQEFAGLANKMTEMKVMVTLFGVKMELLGYDCQVDFDSYCSLYMELYGEKAARFVMEADYP